MPRSSLAIFAALCVFACLGASAATPAGSAGPAATAVATAPLPTSSAEDALAAKSAGTIQGRVTSIDYHPGLMTVDVAQGGMKKTYDVLVVPGTNIQGAKDFHTIADLKKGARVEVLMSRHGTTYTAQIIRIL
jgi:hypothetical protein